MIGGMTFSQTKGFGTMRTTTTLLAACAAAAVLAAAPAAFGQTPGQTTPGILNPSHIRLQNQNLGQRLPGRIVASGIARADTIRPEPLEIIPITEEDAPSIKSALFAETLTQLFQDLNASIVLFQNQLLRRAGRSTVALPSLGSGFDLGGLLDSLTGN